MELPLSEVARNFAQMQRLWIRAEENRRKIEDDLKTMKTQVDTFQDAVGKIEAQLKSLEGPAAEAPAGR